HVDRMVKLLEDRGVVEVVRINSEEYPSQARFSIRLGSATSTGQLLLEASNRTIELDRLTSVWFRHPSPPFVPDLADERDRRFAVAQAKESLVGFLQSQDNVRWINSPWQERAAENKLRQAVVAMSVGLAVPEHIVTNDPTVAKEFITAEPTIYKPLLHAAFTVDSDDTSMRTAATMVVTEEHLSHLDGVRYSPALFQRWVAKDKEYRVTIIDGLCFTAQIDPHRSQGGAIDWRESEEHVHLEEGSLPKAVQDAVLEMMAAFDLSYAAIDLILGTDGVYYFLDLNPSGQFLFIEDALPALQMSDALCSALENA
ncbi:MAG: hypothetical protein R2706_05320, partial [Acidimicrobiales bacterium]